MFARTFWDELNDFRRSFDQVFDNFYTTSRRSAGENEANWAFVPAVETGWTDDFLNLRVVLPGVRQEDIKMTIQGNALVLQGERKRPDDFGKDAFHQMPYGKFERTLELPAGLEYDKLQAHLHEGLLDIRIPVAAAVKPKSIQISTGDAKTQKTIAA